MKKYQMPNVEFVQINTMQVIMVGSDSMPDAPIDGLGQAPRRAL